MDPVRHVKMIRDDVIFLDRFVHSFLVSRQKEMFTPAIMTVLDIIIEHCEQLRRNIQKIEGIKP